MSSSLAAYANFPPPDQSHAAETYRIGPLDTIAVTVFQEPDLSVKDLPVDASGNVVLPLIGALKVSGRTPAEVGQDITRRYSAGYLKTPQVSVVVQDSVSQKVTVEGSVSEPGVYQIKGRTTLLDAVAMAKGTSRVARLDDIVVFRDIEGKQMAALFDLKRIRRGETPNPEILGNDTVVVGLSNIKSAWRDILTASPLVSAFRPVF